MKDIYPIFVRLPDMFNKDRDTIITRAELLAEKARLNGLDVGLIIDYFVADPYHGQPPHVDDDGSITKNKTRRAAGRGFYPFSWVKGWVDARDAITNILYRVEPDYVQQGVNADVINWKTQLEPSKLYYGYNDTMGLFEQATKAANWHGTWVVSGWENKTIKKAREKFGAAMTDTDFLNRCTLEMPDDDDTTVEPPPDDTLLLHDRVALLELVVAKIVNLLAGIKTELGTWENPG